MPPKLERSNPFKLDHSSKEKLSKLEKVPRYDPYNFEGQECYAKVSKVIDGDTVELIVILSNGSPTCMNVRCAHYNAPEIKSKKTDTIEKEKEKKLGMEAKQTVEKAIGGKVVYAKFVGIDRKWSRPLVEIIIPDTDEELSKMMMKCNLGMPYEGTGDKGF